MVYVVKADGSRQVFDRRRVYKTCIRMGFSRRDSEKIAGEVERRVYDGIPTSKILDLIKEEAVKVNPIYGEVEDLRTAVAKLRSKPEFEQYGRIILEASGFQVAPNQIIRGLCVEYELDGLLFRDGEAYILEVKHHVNPNERVDLTVTLKVQAILEDLRDGYKMGVNQVNPSGAYILTNGKFSWHALRYASCRGLKLLGWNTPTGRGIESLISENKLHPVTVFKGLNPGEVEALGDHGVVTLKQLTLFDPGELSRTTGIPVDRCTEICRRVAEVYRRL